MMAKHARTANGGNRLRIAREAAGLTTREVANELLAQDIKVTHATVSNYERGVTVPPDDYMEEVSRLFRRHIAWLKGEGHELAGVRYRCLKAVRERERRQYEDEALRWIELYFHVEKLLRKSLRPLAQHKDFRVSISESGAKIAGKIRARMKLGKYPLPSTARLLEEFGVHVIAVPTDLRIDAFAARVGRSRAVVLNPRVSPDRSRLNALHELAHHLFEDCAKDGHLASDEIEKRAFEFAVTMLIPDQYLEEAMDHKSIVRLVQYKERYGISLAAMFYRARHKGFITPGTYQRVMIEFSKHGLRKQEPGEVVADRPLRMEALIDRAVFGGIADYEGLSRVSGIAAEAIEAKVSNARRAERPQRNVEADDNFSFEAFRARLEDGDH